MHGFQKFRGGPVSAYPIQDSSSVAIECFNDDATEMEFVVRMIQSCFNLNRHAAIDRMLKIHFEGSVIVGYAPSQEVAQELIDHVQSQAEKWQFPLTLRIAE